MTRTAFAHTLMSQSVIYVPSEGSLTPRMLSLPYRSSASPRTLLLAMAQAPVSILPDGLTDADILGLALRDGTILVNFSARYAQLIRAADIDQRLMAYAIVNTLCRQLSVRRVRFYFGGEALETLGSATVWNGEFLYNPARI